MESLFRVKTRHDRARRKNAGPRTIGEFDGSNIAADLPGDNRSGLLPHRLLSWSDSVASTGASGDQGNHDPGPGPHPVTGNRNHRDADHDPSTGKIGGTAPCTDLRKSFLGHPKGEKFYCANCFCDVEHQGVCWACDVRLTLEQWKKPRRRDYGRARERRCTGGESNPGTRIKSPLP